MAGYLYLLSLASFAPRGRPPNGMTVRPSRWLGLFDGDRLLVVGTVGVVATRAAARHIRPGMQPPPSRQMLLAARVTMAKPGSTCRPRLGALRRKFWDNPPFAGRVWHGDKIIVNVQTCRFVLALSGFYLGWSQATPATTLLGDKSPDPSARVPLRL